VRLSIVIPALDEAANLAALLPALRSGEPEAELIVVDGGSRDGTREVAARHPGVRWLEAPRGRATQMNAGARAARGDVLLFLHADTQLPAGAGAAVHAALADARVVAGRFDVAFDTTCPIMRLTAWLMNLRSRWTGISTGDQALFVRRNVFEALGGFAEIPLMEDIDLTRRLKRSGHQAALRRRVTTSARKWQTEGAVRTILLMWTLRLLYAGGVSPATLHGWYYGRATFARPDEPRFPA
jgi:rSAM/selenodomain-associated transferase 2